jgi:DNA-binding NtrC family response regulator
MTMRWRLLAICSAENWQVVESAMTNWSMEVTWCATVQKARRRLRRGNYGLVFCEGRLSDGTYKDVIQLLGPKLGQTRVIVLSDVHKEDCFDEAIKMGVFDLIPASFNRTDVQWIFMHAIQGHPRRQTIPEVISGNATSLPTWSRR